jgi:dephospho-CoA kinase
VVGEFGEGILKEGGTLDRAALRALVFQDEEKRKRLEAILHPLISSEREAWVREQEEAGAPMVVAEIPLLFEAGLEGEFDWVVVVDAPPGERTRRLREDRGLGEEEVGRIMEIQMPSDEKRRRADYVVDNSGSLEDLKIRALALLDLLRARAAGRGGK